MAGGIVTIARTQWVLNNKINGGACKCYFVIKGDDEIALHRNQFTPIRVFNSESELDLFLEDLQRNKIEVTYEQNSSGIQIPIFKKRKQIPQKPERSVKSGQKESTLFEGDNDGSNDISSAYME